ncbi:MAG: class I SAM-dependent methyltransferase [bacterium]
MSIHEFLTGENAFALRRALAPGDGETFDPIRIAAALRRELPAEPARALAEQIELERRARAKFERPERMLFEREALEQATSPGCARHHARAASPGARVVDLGCGLGADSLAFGAGGHRVIAIDRDPARARLAAHNLAVAGARAIVAVGDATALPARGDLLYVDPDRRPRARGRVFSLRETSPDLDAIERWRAHFARVLVKAPPAIPDEEIPVDARVEFLSEGFECREAMLTLGGERGRAAVRTETGERREVEPGPRAPIATDGAFLLDPDPALRRAGGVDAFAREIGAARVAEDSTYLFADRAPDSPWARAYRVRTMAPFRARDLARALAADPPRELVFKQRGVKIPEASLRKGAPRSPDGPAITVVLFARGASRWMAICDSPSSSA